jgi:4-azaleucine resistance transporter AzlC
MFTGGLKQSWPIVVGYLPVAIAFGVSAQSMELGTSIIMLISILIFAGASQFTFIALFIAGTPLITTVLITIGLNLRHLLYSSNLSSEVKNIPNKQRAIIAFGLTDEVFASTFSKIKQLPSKQRWLWILGLEIGAYSSWVIGTFIGIKGSDFLLNNFSEIKPVLNFALPALFLSLLLPLINSKTVFVISIAFTTAFIFTLFGHATIGIFVAAFIGPLIGIFLPAQKKSIRVSEKLFL